MARRRGVPSRWQRRTASLALALIARASSAAPCTSADCTQWLALTGESARVLVYRTHALDARTEAVTRALVVIHGAQRDAEQYFDHASAAATRAGARDETVIIVPRFAASRGPGCHDALAPDELDWHGEQSAAGWRVGGPAQGNARIASFDVVDAILRQLSRRDAFPNLKTIVVAGHSAGGQFVQRYAMANTVHDDLGVGVAYVVANPSSYAYLDGLRPAPRAPTTFVAFADAAACPGWNGWPYGLQQRNGYAARLSDARLRRQIAARPTTYLLGERDVLPVSGFDDSCPARAQGPTRFARGLAYARYVNEHYAAKHDAVIVASCGHDARCMFTATVALPWLFPLP